MQQLIKINLNNSCFFLICFGLVVFSINYEIVLSFRLLDIVFLALFVLFLFLNPKINKIQLAVFSLIVIFYLISNLVSSFGNHFFDFSRLGFIYKYLFIFTVPWAVVFVIKTKKQIKVVNWLLLISFIFLSSWTYVYLSLLSSGKISGSFRPSFPLSSDYMYSDAHLYSSYLGFFAVVYLFYFRNFFNHSMIVAFAIFLNGLVGLVLTGSRTGLILVGLSILIYSLYFILKIFSSKQVLVIRKKVFFYFVLFLFSIFSLIIVFMPSIDLFFHDYERLIERAFNLDLANDQSSQGRIYKLMIGIEDAEYAGLLLGLGIYSSLTWYDGLFSILLAHGGLLFIFSIFLFYYFIVKKAAINSTNQKEFLLFLLLVILYLIANLITEYVFVTRNAFPVLVLLSILYTSILFQRDN